MAGRRASAAVIAVIMAWTTVHGAVDFYSHRLEAGRTALAGQRPTEAEDDLRIAVFGLLDQPKLLTEAMALLAVAQSRAGRTKELDENLARFVRIEQRFTAYEPAALGPYRNEFESVLVKRVSRSALAAVPSLARLTGAQPRATPSNRPATTARPRPTPTPTPPPPAPSPTPARRTPETVRASPGTYEEARTLLDDGRAGEAATVLRELVRREPQQRQLRLTLLQAAVLSSNWLLARDQVRALQPFNNSEPVFMFYGAVALFETGNVAAAREILTRALPRLTRTEYVEYYVRRINGNS
jgi:hypothetical protein